jgi:hypothetical protein
MPYPTSHICPLSSAVTYGGKGKFEECRLLGCYTVWLTLEPTFRRDVSPLFLLFLYSVLQLLVIANVVPSSLILANRMIQAIYSSETSVPTRPTQHDISIDDILHSHRRENLKSYIALTCWTL